MHTIPANNEVVFEFEGYAEHMIFETELVSVVWCHAGSDTRLYRVELPRGDHKIFYLFSNVVIFLLQYHHETQHENIITSLARRDLLNCKKAYILNKNFEKVTRTNVVFQSSSVIYTLDGNGIRMFDAAKYHVAYR